MVNITQLLTLPLLNTLKLINDSSGLYNKVSGTAIFEWENDDDIKRTFSKGEFVVTTLSNVKNNDDLLASRLRTLINLKVSGIAIKSIYFDALPQEIIDLANAKKIPIFFFSDVYIDDLIYEIRQAIVEDYSNDISFNILKEIVIEDDSSQITKHALNLNPTFYSNHISVCIKNKSTKNSKRILKSDYCQYEEEAPNIVFPSASSHSLIMGGSCIFFIYSYEKDSAPSETVKDILNSLFFSNDKYYISYSTIKNDLSEMKASINEAYFSLALAQVDKVSPFFYDQLGIEKLLAFQYNTFHTRAYYLEFDELLNAYDLKHNSNLKETLVVYIMSDGDINLTARHLHQHNNTVRYRISKIKTILGIEDATDSYIQLYIYVRLHHLYSILDNQENLYTN